MDKRNNAIAKFSTHAETIREKLPACSPRHPTIHQSQKGRTTTNLNSKNTRGNERASKRALNKWATRSTTEAQAHTHAEGKHANKEGLEGSPGDVHTRTHTQAATTENTTNSHTQHIHCKQTIGYCSIIEVLFVTLSLWLISHGFQRLLNDWRNPINSKDIHCRL